MSCVHVVLFCNLIGTAKARQWNSTTFPMDVTRLSPPPRFSEESLETRLSSAQASAQMYAHVRVASVV